MLKTYLYIPEHLQKKISHTAKNQNKSKAEVIRQAIQKGLEAAEPASNGAEALLKIAELARKHNIKGPRDASINHDYYLWGGKKRNPKIKLWLLLLTRMD